MTPDQGRRVLLISVSSVRRGADAGLASNGPSRLGMLDLTGAGTRAGLPRGAQHSNLESEPRDTWKLDRRASDLRVCCAPEGIRTPNLLIRSQMLYPLSYGRRCRLGRRDQP